MAAQTTTATTCPRLQCGRHRAQHEAMAQPAGVHAVDPAGAGGGAARAAGAVARWRVLGRVALAGWRGVVFAAREVGSGSSAAVSDLGVDPGIDPAGNVPFAPPTLADAEAVLARAERRAAGISARARMVPPRRGGGTVAAAVAAEEDADDASEVSEVPPIAAVDPEVYAAARREWRFRRGGR